VTSAPNAAERKQLRQRNLDAFKRFAPATAARLRSFKPAAILTFGADGAPDVTLGDNSLYGGNIDAIVAEQVARFRAQPNRISFRPEWAVTCMAYADPFATRLMRRAEAAGIIFSGTMTGLQSPLLAVFGIGLGRHLPPLIEMTGCRDLHLFDANMEFLALSLQTFDWTPIFETLAARGGGVHFFIEANPAAISHELLAWMRHTAPMAIDGTMVFFHSENPDLVAGVRGIADRIKTLLLDLGFFYDESLMLKNTVINLRSGRERIYQRGDSPISDVPVFVIGTGPSLDREFEFLRDNLHCAVIVSAGTALRSLLLNGILPDIQIETENIDVEPVVAETNRQHAVKDIPLIASATTDPKAVAFFDDVRYFFRVPLTPTQVFCDDHSNCLLDANITVGNAALAFAQELGFRDIYIFGMDMGSRVPAEHHSKDSYHYTDGAIVVEPDLKFDIERPANFGGVSYTSVGLSVAMRHIEQSIARHGAARRHFNCSDGSAFKGAGAKRSADIRLTDPAPGRKDAVLDKIFGYFPVMTEGAFAARWDGAKARAACRAAFDAIAAFASENTSLLDNGYQRRLMGQVGQPAGQPPVPFRNLYGGSVLQMFIVAEFFLRRVEDASQQAGFDSIIREEMRRALADLEQATDRLFAEMV